MVELVEPVKLLVWYDRPAPIPAMLPASAKSPTGIDDAEAEPDAVGPAGAIAGAAGGIAGASPNPACSDATDGAREYPPPWRIEPGVA